MFLSQNVFNNVIKGVVLGAGRVEGQGEGSGDVAYQISNKKLASTTPVPSPSFIKFGSASGTSITFVLLPCIDPEEFTYLSSFEKLVHVIEIK